MSAAYLNNVAVFIKRSVDPASQTYSAVITLKQQCTCTCLLCWSLRTWQNTSPILWLVPAMQQPYTIWTTVICLPEDQLFGTIECEM